MIHSNTHAFEILETQNSGIPYQAIRYLYYQQPAKDILEKLIFWLENAYHENVLGENINYEPNAPFWYAIVAEAYLTKELIDPVINLFTTVDEDWDILNEQGAVLVNLLCEKLGDQAIGKFLDKILAQIETQSKFPYLYLFESFKYIDPKKYSEQILQLFSTKSYWLEALLAHLPQVQFSQKKHPELLRTLDEKLEILRLEYDLMETLDHIDRSTLKELINCQEALSKANYPTVKAIEDRKQRDWEAYLRTQESRFTPEEETNDSPPPAPSNPSKIGRNDPCPCGSGKKYKRCCL